MRHRVMGILRAAAMVAAFGLSAFSAPAALAQNCSYNSTQGTCACPTTGPGVTCIGGQLFRSTDSSCQTDTRPGANGTQLFSCASVSFVCNTATYPCAGCTATNPAIVVGAVCSNPINGRYTNACGAGTCVCAAGTQLCSASNTCVTVLSCPAGTTFDPCTNSCSSPNILKDQASPQSAYINISGNITSTAGNLYLTGTGGGQGDFYVGTGKAIRIDGAGATTLSVGNWGGGTLTMFVSGLLAPDSFRLTPGAAAGRVLTSDASGNASWTAPSSGLPAGTANQTLRHNGTAWLANSVLRNDGTAVEVSTTSALPNDIGTTLTLRRTFDSTNESTGFGARIDFNLGGTGAAAIVGRMNNGAPFRRGGLAFYTSDANGPIAERMRLGIINNFAPYQTAVGIGDGTIPAAFSLDIRSTANVASGSTAIINLSNEHASDKVWTGFRMARGAPSAERWFIGMNATDESLRIRRNGSTDDVIVDGAGKLTVSSLQVTGGAVAGRVLTSDASGNATWQTPAGGSCVGVRKYVGSTVPTFNGNRGGYLNADALCNTYNAGSKVCTAEEILNSYKCNAGSDPIATATGTSWVNQGPPGYTAYSNDCDGWTSSAAVGGYYGRFWTFNSVTGGKAALLPCDNTIKYACCE